MHIARRLYVYFVAAVSLAMVVIGLSHLLGLALARIGEALGATAIERSPDEIRRELSLYVALLIVAIPVWLLHWWLAQRAIDRPGDEGKRERASALRALYLTLAMAVPLPWLIVSADRLLRWLFETLFSVPTTNGGTDRHGMEIAIFLVTGAVIASHAAVRRRDTRGDPFTDEAVWLPRLSLYGAVVVGALLLLFGLADLSRVLNDAWFGSRAIVFEHHWWAVPLSGALAKTLVGLCVWALWWVMSRRTASRSDWLGVSERRSSLRLFSIYVIAFVCVLFTLRGVISGLDATIRAILNVPRESNQVGSASAILEPLIIAIPFVLFWLYHRFVVLGSVPDESAVPLAAPLRRFYTYLIAIVGLAYAGIGSARVLGILIDLLLGGTRTVSLSSLNWRDDVAGFGSFALVGLAIWLWQWTRVEQRVAAAGAAERGATTRRLYFYLALAASLVAILVSVAIVIYRAISALLGVNAAHGIVSALSPELGIAIVAALLCTYHITVLRRDLAQREGTDLATATVSLRLITPSDADIDAVIATLQMHLPEGYRLERNDAGRPHQSLTALGLSSPGDDPQAPVIGVPGIVMEKG